MSLLARVPARVAVAALATSLVTSSAVVSAPATAADPRVCVTAKAPTAATQPWHEFATTRNQMWSARDRLVAMVADIDAAAAQLGPASSEAEIDHVRAALLDGPESWFNTFKLYYTDHQSTMDLVLLTSALHLVAPDTVAAARTELVDAYVANVIPEYADLVHGDERARAYLDTYVANLTGTYPLSGPVAIPSSAAVIDAVNATARAFDDWYALGQRHVVLSSTPTTTCTTTATVHVPRVSTTFGRAATAAISATRDGVASRGDLAVLLDGRRIGSATRVSSYTAAIPDDLPAGRHVLTVAFAPVDGSPVSTASSTVTVAKARSTVSLVLSKSRIRAGTRARATVRVVVPGTALRPSGTARIKVGRKTYTAKISHGRGQVLLGRPAAGRYSLRASYAGTASLTASRSSRVRLVVRK